jgi:hypothetical protein
MSKEQFIEILIARTKQDMRHITNQFDQTMIQIDAITKEINRIKQRKAA